MKKREAMLTVRMEPDLLAAFQASIEKESAMLGLDRPSMTVVVRNMVREYNLRVTSTLASENGRYAAKVLARAPGKPTSALAKRRAKNKAEARARS